METLEYIECKGIFKRSYKELAPFIINPKHLVLTFSLLITFYSKTSETNLAGIIGRYIFISILHGHDHYLRVARKSRRTISRALISSTSCRCSPSGPHERLVVAVATSPAALIAAHDSLCANSMALGGRAGDDSCKQGRAAGRLV